MDNKPLEELAENYIKTRLSKAKIKYLKPNYDTDGADLVLLNPLNKHIAKQVIIQSKGRNLTEKPSNVSIPAEYVVSNFVCFLYLEVDGDLDDYFYIFFSEDIKKWNESNGKYILSIPKGFKSHNYFEQHRFDASSHIKIIEELLNNAPMLRQSYVEFENMELKEIIFEMWKKYDSFPDLNLVTALYDDFYELTGSSTLDVFAICAIANYLEDLDYRSLDFFMQELFIIRNIDKPIKNTVTIHNPEQIRRLNSSWSIVYNRVWFGQVDVTYDGIDYKGLYCYIGDNEDHVEVLLFDNGDYVCFGKRVSCNFPYSI
ncbi:hypothetical protein [Celerinatantimonas sp. MCCC 1A17872]|uniref:hypothetical protein n=1 Tax=Celerinatantimonas sp. MCCC 1A17872 TaxID=3177514 RepID=UPI0038C2C10D